MATDLSALDETELVALNNDLSVQRAQAADEVKTQQLEINSEISKRQLRRRLEGMSGEELTELGKMIKEAKAEAKTAEAQASEEEPSDG